MLYNRVITERVRGDRVAAWGSFEWAVWLSCAVNSRNPALAQLAHRQGNYVVVIEQCQSLIKSRIARNRNAISHNLARANEDELQQVRLAEVLSTAMGY